MIKIEDEIENISKINKIESDLPLPKRRLHLLETGYLSDCSFLVGEESDESEKNSSTNSDSPAETKLFRCHKMLLATASEAFERMFYGSFIDQPNPIKVVDIEPNIFQIFLEYIYTNEIAPANVNMENINKLMYIGDKYLMNNFIDNCIQILKAKPWALENILPIFEAASMHNNLSLKIICFEKMKEQKEQETHAYSNYANTQSRAKMLLEHPTFYNFNIDHMKPLCALLKQLPGNILQHSDIIKAIATYAKKNNLHTKKHSEEFKKLLEAVYTVNPKYVDISSYTYKLGSNTCHLIFGHQFQ